VTASTFPDLLADQVRRSGSRPLVTFYDDLSGERVELSVVTFANWVAKTASLLQDEVGLERGDTVLIDLPTHWLGPVWLGACWSLGLAVTTDPSARCDLVVCGPHGIDRYAANGRPGIAPVIALSLLPMGQKFRQTLPQGVIDFGAVVWGQPDAFVAYDPPEPADTAWTGATDQIQAQLIARAAAHSWSTSGTRLLTDVPPCSEDGLLAFLAPLMAGGGTVWVSQADPDCWDRRSDIEQATVVVRTDPAQPA
jgi:uncharacterized protein (TIGR03089 family)